MIPCRYVNQEYQARMKILQAIDNLNDTMYINGDPRSHIQIADDIVNQLKSINLRGKRGSIMQYANNLLYISEQVKNSMNNTPPIEWIMTRYRCMLLIDTTDTGSAVDISHSVIYYKRNPRAGDHPYYGYGGEVFTDEPLLIGNQPENIDNYKTAFPDNMFYPHDGIIMAINEYITKHLTGTYVYECVPHHAHVDHKNRIAYYRCYSEAYIANTLFNYTANYNKYGYIVSFKDTSKFPNNAFPITNSMMSPLMTYNDKPVYRYNAQMFSFLKQPNTTAPDLDISTVLDWTLVENVQQVFQEVYSFTSITLPKHCNATSTLTSLFLRSSFVTIRGCLPNQVDLSSLCYGCDNGILLLTNLRVPNCIKLGNAFNSTAVSTIYMSGIDLRFWSIPGKGYKPTMFSASPFSTINKHTITVTGEDGKRHDVDTLSLTVYVASKEDAEVLRNNSDYKNFSTELVDRYLLIQPRQGSTQ